MAQVAGQLRQRQPCRLDMVGGSVGPGVPGRSMMASGSPDPAGPWWAKAASGWNRRSSSRSARPGPFRVRGHDRRVDVDTDEPAIRAGRAVSWLPEA